MLKKPELQNGLYEPHGSFNLVDMIRHNNLPYLNHFSGGGDSKLICKGKSWPKVSYRRCNNLRDILVRATHRRPPPKTPGAFRCNRSRCKTCPFITEGTTFYTFFSTNEQRQILHHISCSSSNLIYMIQCSRCKVQYIGESKSQLSDRFGEYRRAMEKAITHRHIDQPTAVSDHFTLPAWPLH